MCIRGNVRHLQAATIEISIINRCGFYNGARVRFSRLASSLSITTANDNDIKEARVIRYIRSWFMTMTACYYSLFAVVEVVYNILHASFTFLLRLFKESEFT